MNTLINSILIKNNTFISEVKLFGHSSKSLPGLELIGLNKQGRIIKEKIIFITRKCQIKIPLNRYVICLESDNKVKNFESVDLNMLELPILILYWSMAGAIPIKRLDNVYSFGQIMLDHGIEIPVLDQIKGWQRRQQTILLCPETDSLPSDIVCLPIDQLINNQAEFSIRWQEYEQDLGKAFRIHA